MTPVGRLASFIAGFAIALTATGWLIVDRLDAAGVEVEQLTRHAVAEYYTGRVADSIEHAHRPDVDTIVFLGDSMVVSYPNAFQIPALLGARLKQRGPAFSHVAVLNLGLAGTGVYDYYFMAGVVGRLDPELVIIAFNLTSTSQDFRAAFARPELAGWLPARELASALTLPMSWIGLTADRLFFSKAVIATGGFDLQVELTEEQMRVERARELVEAAVASTGPHRMSPEAHFRKRRANRMLARNSAEEGMRHTAAATLDQYGASLAGLSQDHPVIEMLGATVARYVDRGSDVLVYLNPTNIDYIATLGLMNREGLDRSIEAISNATTSSGGHFVDLHALLPDAGFRDRSGHFAYEGEINGPREVADRLAPAVAQLMQEHARARKREARSGARE